MAFDYSFPFQETDPNCQAKFTRSFVHRDWVDAQDAVQAQATAEEEGFNSRFHKIGPSDHLSDDVTQAFASIRQLRTELFQLLQDIKTELNRPPEKTSKEFKDGKDTKDGKDAKDGKDTKDAKDGKDGKDTKDAKDGKDGKDSKDGKDTKENKDHKDGRRAGRMTRHFAAGSPRSRRFRLAAHVPVRRAAGPGARRRQGAASSVRTSDRRSDSARSTKPSEIRRGDPGDRRTSAR